MRHGLCILGRLRGFCVQGVHMRKLRSALILLGASVLVVSFAVPKEDAVSTQYDESETLPYESAPPSPSSSIEAHGGADVMSHMFITFSYTSSTECLTPEYVVNANAAESLPILDCALRR
jgi:hypothetical protein